MKKWTLIIALSLASLVACKKEVVLPETRLDIVKSYKNIDAYMFRGVYDSLLVAELLNDSLLCKEISIENGSIKEGTSFLHKGVRRRKRYCQYSPFMLIPCMQLKMVGWKGAS